MAVIEEGRKAPPFALQDQDGTTHRLKDYAARTGQLNPTLGLWLIGQRIPRHQYHEVFPLLRATVNHEIRTIDVRGLLLPVDHRLDLSGGHVPGK